VTGAHGSEIGSLPGCAAAGKTPPAIDGPPCSAEQLHHLQTERAKLLGTRNGFTYGTIGKLPQYGEDGAESDGWGWAINADSRHCLCPKRYGLSRSAGRDPGVVARVDVRLC
jgi:hypothetical protein